MFFLIFVMDVIYTICKECIALQGSDKHAAIATTAVFGVLAFSTFLISLLQLICSKKKWLPFCLWLVHIIIVEIYFYGKNISSIVNKFGDELGCDEHCVRNNRLAAIGCMGFTLLLLYTIPLLHDYIKKQSGNQHHPLWHYFYGVILVLVHINSMYSAVLSIIPEELECSIESLVLSVAFLLFATFIGWTSIFTDKEIWARNDHPREMWNYIKQDCLLHGAALVCGHTSFLLAL